MDLKQDEMNSYANGGWIVEDLDTYQQGGELPKAARGKPGKTYKFWNNKKYTPGKYTFPYSEGKVVPTPNLNATKIYWDMWNKDYSGPLVDLDEFLAIGGGPTTDSQTKERLEYALVCHEAMPAVLKIAMIEWIESH